MILDQTILVELDALLDTRLSIIYKQSPDYVLTALKNGYHERPNDDFSLLVPGLDINVYKSNFAERTTDDLVNSKMTPIPLNVFELTNGLINKKTNSPLTGNVVLAVNIFPYRFTKEGEEKLISYLHEYVGAGTKIEIVNLSMLDLTPEYIKDKYPLMIMYNFNEWIRTQYGALVKNPLPRNTVIAPMLVEGTAPSDRQLNISEYGGTVNPFASFSFMLNTVIEVIFKEVSSFSVYMHKQ